MRDRRPRDVLAVGARVLRPPVDSRWTSDYEGATGNGHRVKLVGIAGEMGYKFIKGPSEIGMIIASVSIVNMCMGISMEPPCACAVGPLCGGTEMKWKPTVV